MNGQRRMSYISIKRYSCCIHIILYMGTEAVQLSLDIVVSISLNRGAGKVSNAFIQKHRLTTANDLQYNKIRYTIHI